MSTIDTTARSAMKLALEALEHLQPTAMTSFYTIGDRDKAITALREALAEQPAPVAKPHEQEPVACIHKGHLYMAHEFQSGQCPIDSQPLYTSPPAQRTWVGLTPQDQKEIQRQSVYVEGAIRMTEAKLKEKNT